MINGVRVRDSGVELSPTGTDVGRPENGIQPRGSSFFGNRGRIDAVAHAADQTATFGQGRLLLHRQLPNSPKFFFDSQAHGAANFGSSP